MLDLALTVGEGLTAARARLAAAGVDDPRGAAEDLYARLVCGGTSAAWEHRDRPMGTALAARLEAASDRLAAGWPAQYAAGRANFRGHWLAADARALIPRPETEGLVDLVAAWVDACAAPPLVADVGTGSGAIAISLALETRAAGVIATDVSGAALALAIENATALGAAERISFRRGDLLLPLLDDRVDAIVSNPPYVTTAEWERLLPGVRAHEPREALDGGADGLDHTRRLASQAPEYLRPGGTIWLEIDAQRGSATAALLAAAGFTDVAILDDLSGRPRYARGRRPEH